MLLDNLSNAITSFNHQPVMQATLLAVLQQHNWVPRFIIDCTVGGGGHAAALLSAFPAATYLGFDCDREALAAAALRLQPFGTRVQLHHHCFSQLLSFWQQAQLPPADLILADLGVSSYQLDNGYRGFSFRHHGPLDMRMDQHQGQTAQQMLANVDTSHLTHILATLGQERYASRIARALVASPPATTTALAAMVHRLVPRGHQRCDAATRTFMGLRIWVNQEIEKLRACLASIAPILADEGVVAAISFHSLEDRLVKQSFRALAQHCQCPPRLPECRCQLSPTLKLLSLRALRPSPQEISANPRARSARMRIARRLPRCLA